MMDAYDDASSRIAGFRNPMTDSSKRFEVLRARYARSLASKHTALAQAWRGFAEGADETRASELQDLAHRLAGSAPAYGYAALGEHAGNVDREIANWRDADPNVRENPGALARRLSVLVHGLIESLARHADEASDGSAG
jgi:HPt (histidine-containing phosphotransfer) domain-containing protein